jgi:hypothetical protein
MSEKGRLCNSARYKYHADVSAGGCSCNNANRMLSRTKNLHLSLIRFCA